MNNAKLPAWFWILAALSVAWNLMGVGAYLADVMMSEDALMKLPDAERQLRAATPAWVTGAYAIAVFAGLGAALSLLLRRRIAIALFGVSLIAVIVQMGYVFGGMQAAAVLGAGSMTFPAIIIVLGVLQLWFAMQSGKKGWLR